MANLQNHKGSFCNYKSIFCQEGYCAGFEIYLRVESSAAKINGRQYNIKNIRELQAGISQVRY